MEDLPTAGNPPGHIYRWMDGTFHKEPEKKDYIKIGTVQAGETLTQEMLDEILASLYKSNPQPTTPYYWPATYIK